MEYYGNDKILVYDGLYWLEDEMRFVYTTLDKLFPANWGVSAFIQDVL